MAIKKNALFSRSQNESEYDSFHDLGKIGKRLRDASPDILRILRQSRKLDAARNNIYDFLDARERFLLKGEHGIPPLERCVIHDCINAFRSIIAPLHEKVAGFSALENLWKFARAEPDAYPANVSPGFLMEFYHIFSGISGKADIYPEYRKNGQVKPEFLKFHGRRAARIRMNVLDQMAEEIDGYFERYPGGMEKDILLKRRQNRKRILRYFKASLKDWNNYFWQLKNVICDHRTLTDLIQLSEEEVTALSRAEKAKIPWGITPYYLSLMDYDRSQEYDHAVRAQVIPVPQYIDCMIENLKKGKIALDFMGEQDTSPEALITRRYPKIAIIKPFNTCPQICVYCQRNWEIEAVHDPKAMAPWETIYKALSWFDEHPGIQDVLITGGDPCMMRDRQIERILSILSKKSHIYRIRIGTRTPVTIPMRWTDSLIRILLKYHDPGRREIAIVTHYEHSSEITPESLQAIRKVRKAGMNVYNQEVFTVENSRRFESSRLRRDLRLIGVAPYYTFNMKGKDETRHMMAPIARLLQERKEEARLLPGLDRTDEPVFNVPRLGKNHLRAWQDHILVMIMPDGSRMYELHPWEKNISLMPPYYYTDVPIYDYLKNLAERGEDIRDYKTIWYYF
ncbi:KamA family radical SAM protein [Candidatus Sumerlaeota bacterium]|nr:KamA family radical SAM protein [Candidatus Sumerlaeota bacterium]